jgi:hypothetical protein
VQDPAGALAGARGEQCRPRLVLVAGNGDQVQVVGNFGAAEQLEGVILGLVERQDGDEATIAVAHVSHVEAPAFGEDGGPVVLPGRAEKR